jgi:hypothetical protein
VDIRRVEREVTKKANTESLQFKSIRAFNKFVCALLNKTKNFFKLHDEYVFLKTIKAPLESAKQNATMQLFSCVSCFTFKVLTRKKI